MSDNSRKVAGIRWWPAAVIALAGACALGWVWLPEGADRQSRVMSTFPIAFAMLLLLAIWLAFFSRLPRSRRLWAIGAVLVTIAATAATTRIRGVTGDLVPILEWRWASREPPALRVEPLREGPAATPDAPAAAPASGAPGEPPSPSSVSGSGGCCPASHHARRRRLSAIPRRRSQRQRCRHSSGRRLDGQTASAGMAPAPRSGMVGICRRSRARHHARAAWQP